MAKLLKTGVCVSVLMLLAGGSSVRADREADAAYYRELHELHKELAAKAASAAGDRAKLAAFEAELIAALASDSLVMKRQSCKMLARIGTDKAVPALSALLADEQVSHAARYALEGIGSDKAKAAVRRALGEAEGRLKIGMLASLGTMKDEEAVPGVVAWSARPSRYRSW